MVEKSSQIVLITGANSGIGYEIVKKLSTEYGETYHVLLGARNPAKLDTAYKAIGSPANVTPFLIDITDDASIDNAVAKVEADFGRLDVLVNNAAISGFDIPDDGSSRRRFNAVFDTNATSAAVVTEKFAHLLNKSALAKVVFVSSTLGSITYQHDHFAFFDSPAYGASKATMNWLTVFYARKYPTWRVNAVCPGYNATPLNGVELTEELHPKHGAAGVSKLITANMAGWSATFSGREGPLPW